MDNDDTHEKMPEHEWSTFVDYVSRFGYEHATEMLGMSTVNVAHEQNSEALDESLRQSSMGHGCGMGQDWNAGGVGIDTGMGCGFDMFGSDTNAF